MHSHLWRLAQPYLLSLLLVATAAGVLLPFRDSLDSLDIALIFLIVIAGLSLRVDTGPGIVASIAAFLCFNALFIPPYYTFSVARSKHVLTLFAFLGIAILITQLVVRLRERTAEDLRRGRQTATLYALSTALISEIRVEDMLVAVVKRVREMFALDSCVVLLDEQGTLVPRAQAGNSLSAANTNLMDLARWVMEKRQLAGLGETRAKLRPSAPRGQPVHWGFALGRRDRTLLVVPIATVRGSLGALVVARRQPASGFDAEEAQLLETFANHAAIAIERSLLTEEQTHAEILARSDALKSSLLRAVSHDLRTPLSSIKAAATSLLQPGVHWDEGDRRELLEAIDQEADRLNHLVANLLNLSRIEAGALQPNFAWYELSEIIYEAIRRARPQLQGHDVVLDLMSDLPPAHVDYVEIVQVLVNLLENAAKYAPGGTQITLSARKVGDAIEVAVGDEGPGIPVGEEERIFDTFYQVEAPHRLLGSGVGLAICRGFIEAHHGRIWAERNPSKGLTIRFTLPLPSHDHAPNLSPASAEART